MRTSRSRLSMTLLSAAFISFFAIARTPDRQNPAIRFQEAIDLMETKGDNAGAIKIFEVLVKAPDRSLAARSLYYLGFCHEKLGNDRAKKAYERLIQEFADQDKLVAMARSRLAAMQQAGAGSGGLIVRKVWPYGKEAGADISTGSLSPDGRFVAAPDWAFGHIAILELATGRIQRLKTESQTIGDLWGCTWSHDGKLVAYLDASGSAGWELCTVALDGSKPRVVFAGQKDTRIRPFAWSPDGKDILAVISQPDGSNQMSLVAVSDGSVRVLKSLKGTWQRILRPYTLTMAFSRDGRYVAHDHLQGANTERDISIYSIQEKRDIPLVTHTADDRFLGWTPDGNHILFASNRSGSHDAYIVRVEKGVGQGEPVLIKTGIGEDINPIGLSPAGSFYYFSFVGMSDVYAAEFDPVKMRLTSQPRKMDLPKERGNSWPQISPDGKHLAYMRERGLRIRNLEKGEERVIPIDFRPYFPNWTSDGKAIVAAGRDNQERMAIYRVSILTAQVEPMLGPSSKQYFGEGVLSADGKSLFYLLLDVHNRRMQIMVRDPEKETEHELYRHASGLGLHIALSPDGRRLAVTNRDRDRFLKVLATSGGEPRTLCTWEQRGGHWNDPVWTPDGRHILFSRDRAHELWSIAAEGGEPEMLGRMDFMTECMSVHPDGRRIVFGGRSWPNVSGIWVMDDFLPKNDP